jgi:hypothetical protein
LDGLLSRGSKRSLLTSILWRKLRPRIIPAWLIGAKPGPTDQITFIDTLRIRRSSNTVKKVANRKEGILSILVKVSQMVPSKTLLTTRIFGLRTLRTLVSGPGLHQELFSCKRYQSRPLPRVILQGCVHRLVLVVLWRQTRVPFRYQLGAPMAFFSVRFSSPLYGYLIFVVPSFAVTKIDKLCKVKSRQNRGQTVCCVEPPRVCTIFGPSG